MDSGMLKMQLAGVEVTADVFRWMGVLSEIEQRNAQPSPAGEATVRIPQLARETSEAMRMGVPDVVDPIKGLPTEFSDAVGYEFFKRIVEEFGRQKKSIDERAESSTPPVTV